MSVVYTTKGPLARDLLTVKDIVSETATARAIATEWYLGDELVRRDVAVSGFMPMEIGATAGKVG